MRFFYNLDGDITIEAFEFRKKFIYINLNLSNLHKTNKCIIENHNKIEESSYYKEFDIYQIYFDKNIKNKLLKCYPITSFYESCKKCNYQCEKNKKNKILFNKLNEHVKKINEILKNLQEID